MKLNFKRYFRMFFEIRLEEILSRFSNRNKRCVKINQQIIEVQNQILIELGEKSGLIVEYEAIESAKYSLILERVYFQGLVDGIRTSKYSPK